MSSRQLNVPRQIIQRDGWSEEETEFLVNAYNHHRHEIGKNKLFPSKKQFFSCVAESMPTQKTASQVSSRFYTLTRKPKTPSLTDPVENVHKTKIQLPILGNETDTDTNVGLHLNSAEMETIPNQFDDDTSICNETILNETEFDCRKVESADENPGFTYPAATGQGNSSFIGRSVAINLPSVTGFEKNPRSGIVYQSSASNHTFASGELCTQSSDVSADHNALESIWDRTKNVDVRTAEMEAVSTDCDFDASIPNETIFNGTENFDCENIESTDENPGLTYPSQTGQGNSSVIGRSVAISLPGVTSFEKNSRSGIVHQSLASNYTVSSGALHTIETSNISTSYNRLNDVRDATKAKVLPASIQGTSTFLGRSVATVRSLPTTHFHENTFPRISYQSSTNNSTITSGALRAIQTSDISVNHNRINDIREATKAIAIPTSIQETSKVTGRSVATVRCLPSVIDLTAQPSFVDLTARSSFKLPSSSRNNMALVDNSNDVWTNSETEWLLEKYYQNINEVGPLKRHRNKKDMWDQMAEDMVEYFPVCRTGVDLSKQVERVIKQKKKNVERNRTSGASRTSVEYEDAIDKITSVDDSIEPEVLRDATSVQYKKNIKREVTTKPRWDKPNKKGIQTMLSMEKRLEERDKAREKRREKTHLEFVKLLASMKSRESQG
ncbi:hypothetical protein Bhyg_12468 [Pseudolycoriella hygida]|uniref:Myb-like domain-containing protein n=1 Tax=Pseudolycoriella hygida TaxID=35572 RepID=A0A9Q0S0W5_9DIPT|nr:hypothetical protein Bhyg_12468 [Pseudolycoriella hygida]